MPNLNKLGLVLLSMERWAAAKELSVSVVVPPAPVRVSSQRPLAPSVASVTSVANKGDTHTSQSNYLHFNLIKCGVYTQADDNINFVILAQGHT